MDPVIPENGDMKLQRILKMGPTEIVYRTWQEATKSLDRMTVKASEISHQSPCVFNQLRSDPALAEIQARKHAGDFDGAARSLMENFYTAAKDRFFNDVLENETTEYFSKHFVDFGSQVRDAAESVCRRQFRILGYGDVYFGNPIKWNLDPISGHQVSPVHWSRIDPLNSDMVGDSKVVWELNRHQWLVELGQAYRFTGEEKYANVFTSYIRAWMRANPPGLGINWTSSLEVAMRLISWCWALMLFRGSKALTPTLFVDMMAWTGTHASYIERYLSYYFSPNTHLTGEALGLYYAGVVFPELSGSDRWRKLGRQILEDQIQRQVYIDGVYFEQSTRYQYYTVEIYLHFLILAGKNNEQVSPVVEKRIQQMLDFLLMVRQPDGSIPQIGDSDGGWLLPFVRRAPDDHRGLFSTAAVLFARNDYAWAAEGLAPETVWLLGNAGPEAYASLLPAPPDAPPSHMFPYGGYAIMRSGWDNDAHQMIFDAGPLGCPYSSGHGHADLLSIQCSVFGKPYLIDPGTYCYTADEKLRNYFRSTFAHNTVVVDGTSQAAPKGPFAWDKKVKATLRRWVATDDFVLVDADHDAYQQLSDPVTHRRRVLFSNQRYWIVVDDLDGRAEHQLDLCYQFSSQAVALKNESWVEAAGNDGRGLRVRAFSTVRLDAHINKGGLNPIHGWVSPDYGQQHSAPQLVYSTRAELPVRIVTLLLPVEDMLTAPPVVEQHMKGRSMYLTMNDGQQTIMINDHDIIVKEENSQL